MRCADGGGRVTLDLSGAIPLQDRSGRVTDIGPLVLALLREPDSVSGSRADLTPTAGTAQNATITLDLYVPLGDIPYRDPDWLVTTGGIVYFKLPDALDPPIGERPLAIIESQGVGVHHAAREYGRMAH